MISSASLPKKIKYRLSFGTGNAYINESNLILKKYLENKDWKELIQLIETDGIGIIHIWFGDVGSSLTTLNFLQQKSKLPILVEADIESGLGRRYNGSVRLPPMMAIACLLYTSPSPRDGW